VCSSDLGLKELPLPEPVSWWPQTIGWYLVGIIILGAIMWILWRFWQRYQKNLYRREGLKELDSITQNPQDLVKIPLLLRRSALHAAPRSNVANLRGSDWINWLNESLGSKLFEEGDAGLLEELAFARPDRISIDSKSSEHLIEASRVWMRSHRVAI